MAASYVNNSPSVGKVTVKFEWWADIAKATEIVSNAAEFAHSRGYGPKDGNGVQIPFASLTNQQILTILYDHTTDAIRDTARQWRLDTAVDTARDDALATPESDEFD